MAIQDSQVATFDNQRKLNEALTNLISLLGVADYSATNLGAFTGRTLADNLSLTAMLQAFETQFDINFSIGGTPIGAGQTANVSDAHQGFWAVSPTGANATFNAIGLQPKIFYNNNAKYPLRVQGGVTQIDPGYAALMINNGAVANFSPLAIFCNDPDSILNVQIQNGDYTWQDTDRALYWGGTAVADGLVTLQQAGEWQLNKIMRVVNLSGQQSVTLRCQPGNTWIQEATDLVLYPRDTITFMSTGGTDWAILHHRRNRTIETALDATTLAGSWSPEAGFGDNLQYKISGQMPAGVTLALPSNLLQGQTMLLWFESNQPNVPSYDPSYRTMGAAPDFTTSTVLTIHRIGPGSGFNAYIISGLIQGAW